MTLLNIIDTLNEWVKPFKDFVDTNHNNPLMWIGFLLVGIAIFSMTYSALHKDR
ncbi:MAG: hypothetical protein IKE75_02410 [Bacilli bacterium]|nr:hypothetical protein [Bacilli bacterium]